MNGTVSTPRKLDIPDVSIQMEAIAATVNEELKTWFGVDFTIWDVHGNRVLLAGEDRATGDEFVRGELIKQVSATNKVEFIGDEDGVVVLALPFTCQFKKRYVATAEFTVYHAGPDDSVSAAANMMAWDETKTREWIRRQAIWSTPALEGLGRAAVAKLNETARVKRMEREVEKVSDNLAATYEEICLIYSVTQNLRISASDEELGTLALECLIDCIPATGVAIQYLPVAEEDSVTYDARTSTLFLTDGDCPVTTDELSELIEQLGLGAGCPPYVANHNITESESWKLPKVRQLVLVPLSEGDNIFGWLAAFNHEDDEEFGTVEASLLNSLGVMLGIHSGNRELYRQREEFLADVVRALSSAIDAKDPYTCGHSDRVARVSVRLAKELGADADTLHTIYMAGLLHDIGKIGVDDRVLRKPDRLTEEEFEQIKLHPELGFNILRDIKRLSSVLPAVLHHHERVDGQGYPHGLAGENIPWIARVMAVADAYDAMHSDRPYRKGMPLEKVEAILRDGCGTQWNDSVIEAYFAASEDIRNISEHERENLTLDVRKWAIAYGEARN